LRILYDCSSEDQSILSQIMEKYEAVVPVWVKQIRFVYDSTLEDICTINVNDPYLDACITVSPRWRARFFPEQTEDIVHELSHLYTCPMMRPARSLAVELENPIKDFALEQLRVAMETATEHLCQTFLRIV